MRDSICTPLARVVVGPVVVRVTHDAIVGYLATYSLHGRSWCVQLRPGDA